MARLLVVDDHRLIFEGLHRYFTTGWTLVWAPTLAAARTALAESAFDFLLLDISLGRESGLEALEEFAAQVPTFVLTMHDAPVLASQARELGARGYFLKDDSLDALFSALTAPLSDDFLISPGMPKLENEKTSSGYESLTGREQQVFVLLAEDLGYKEIASRLKLSPKTINAHRSNLMTKLGLRSHGELVTLARHLGLIAR
jgi:two-component system uhpT operon response regulator UhpA